ncbi:MAG: glycosyltransferase [Chitinophagales bacterium]|nr:glycosyltransferase [Chitinophagales bacterium]
MKLSIVIVNYNVKYFLHQTLNSVFKSVVDFEYEVFVVDNASVDDSVEMIKTVFPQVRLIESKENLGFSKGNNLAIRKSQAEYILLLNPDTVIQEDTLQQVVDFMDKHQDAGAVGVKMYDGGGHFLPESKRGFPSPKVAFYKMFGLSKLFPQSKEFGTYHLTYLDKDEIHEVDVLSGAFMLLRKRVLNEVGLLDEDYFMYGEDIDLSYKVVKAGYKNYYYPHASIIHFKGESTKKGSLNYVRVFYQAMIIFAQKHLSDKKGGRLIGLLKFAIVFRAGLTLLNNFFTRIGRQFIDIFILSSVFWIVSWYWEHSFRLEEGLTFSDLHFKINLPIYLFIWITFNYLYGVYERVSNVYTIFVSMLLGTIVIAAVYGFLPIELRTSRGIILMTFFLGTFFISLYRMLLAWRKGHLKQMFYDTQRLIIVAAADESKRILTLMNEINQKREFVGYVSPDQKDAADPLCLGNSHKIWDIIQMTNVDEIIFSAKDINTYDIIRQISSYNKNIKYRIAVEETDVIISSESKNLSGELFTYDIGFKINLARNIRFKRFVDINISLLILILSPILFFIQKNKKGFFKNVFCTLNGAKTWVSYYPVANENRQLPVINHGVLNPLDNLNIKPDMIDSNLIIRQNYLYAKDYNVLTDILTVFNSLIHLGREMD